MSLEAHKLRLAWRVVENALAVRVTPERDLTADEADAISAIGVHFSWLGEEDRMGGIDRDNHEMGGG